jgi:hypothetical protein
MRLAWFGYPADPTLADPAGPRPLNLGWHAVRLTLATILLIAAALKAHQIMTDPAVRVGMYGPLWVALVIVCVELLMAAWLLLNVRPAWARRASICLVGVFAAASLHRLLSGEPDCGCFGTMAIPPGWTLTLDVILLLALSYGPPANGTAGSQAGADWMQRIRQYGSAVLSPLAIAAIVAGAMWLMSSAGLLPLDLFQGPKLISVDPSPQATFQAREGDTVTAKFTIKNFTD